MPKVSVIVPVYKAEKYLRQCIESILAQTFTDWECILVDDGSPDHSGAICDEYAARDARIRVIHKENGGVSSARNVGLDNVKGDWITFLDADDCIYKNALLRWIDTAEINNLDLVQCHFNRTYNEQQFVDDITDAISYQEYATTGGYSVCVGGNLFRSLIINKIGLRFNNSVRYGEDQIFIFNYMVHCQRIQRIKEVLYYYRDNEDSSTRQVQNTSDLLHSISELSKVDGYQDIFHHRIQQQIQIFLERILCNYDMKSKSYNDVFLYYYDAKVHYLRALVVYNKLLGIAPSLSYYIFGRIYSIYHKIKWI